MTIITQLSSVSQHEGPTPLAILTAVPGSTWNKRPRTASHCESQRVTPISLSSLQIDLHLNCFLLSSIVTNFIMKAFINGRKLFGTPFYPLIGREAVSLCNLNSESFLRKLSFLQYKKPNSIFKLVLGTGKEMVIAPCIFSYYTYYTSLWDIHLLNFVSLFKLYLPH